MQNACKRLYKEQRIDKERKKKGTAVKGQNVYCADSSVNSQHISLLLHYKANIITIVYLEQTPQVLAFDGSSHHYCVDKYGKSHKYYNYCQQLPRASMAFVDKFHKIPPGLLWLAMNWSLSLWFVLMIDVFISRWIQNLGAWEPGNEAKFNMPLTSMLL